jgi:hypothetical protein
MKLHKEAVSKLFKDNDKIFNALEVYKLYEKI